VEEVVEGSAVEASDSAVDSDAEDLGVEDSEAEAVDLEAVAVVDSDSGIAESEVREVGITAEQLYKYAVLITSIPPVLDHCSNPHVRPKICTLKAYRVRNVSSLVAPKQYGC
jgi:hypothetical protein